MDKSRVILDESRLLGEANVKVYTTAHGVLATTCLITAMSMAGLGVTLPSATADDAEKPAPPMLLSELIEVSRQSANVSIEDAESGRSYSGSGIAVVYESSVQGCRVYYNASDPQRDVDPRGSYSATALSEVIVAQACDSSVTWQPLLSYFQVPPGTWGQRDAGVLETTPPGQRDAGFVLDWCEGFAQTSWRNRINSGGAAAVASLRCS